MISVYTTNVVWKFSRLRNKDEDNVQYFVNKVYGQSKIVQKLCIRKIKKHKQVKLDVLRVNDFDLNVSLFPNDYNNQPAILPKRQFNTFTDMPIPPPPPQPYIKKSHVEYHGISVGDDFCNKNECMYTIGVKSLREAFQYAVIKSCPQRYNVKCVQPDCQWNIYTHKVKDDADGRFEMLYVGFGCAIRSFLRCMRPLIIIDGAHLKRNYLGTNLLSVGMDGNNQMLPLATSVSQGESGESWT
nr:transposase, MuDR, MULE transposase domain protein [Tanacetum cinerariifolium]